MLLFLLSPNPRQGLLLFLLFPNPGLLWAGKHLCFWEIALYCPHSEALPGPCEGRDGRVLEVLTLHVSFSLVPCHSQPSLPLPGAGTARTWT